MSSTKRARARTALPLSKALSDHRIRELRRVRDATRSDLHKAIGAEFPRIRSSKDRGAAGAEMRMNATAVLLLHRWREAGVRGAPRRPEPVLPPMDIAAELSIPLQRLYRIDREFRKRVMKMPAFRALAFGLPFRSKPSKVRDVAELLRAFLPANRIDPNNYRGTWTLAGLAQARLVSPDGKVEWLIPHDADTSSVMDKKTLRSRVQTVARALEILGWQLDGQYRLRASRRNEVPRVEDDPLRFSVARHCRPRGKPRGSRSPNYGKKPPYVGE